MRRQLLYLLLQLYSHEKAVIIFVVTVVHP